MTYDDVAKVYSFDGQTIWCDRNTILYEVGNYLGGGAAGTVYECEFLKTREHFALKILNPLGYKITSPALLRRYSIISKGRTVTDVVEKSKDLLSNEHVWWLINGSTKQYIAAYYSERNNSLREFSLTQCHQVWGSDPSSVGDEENGEADKTIEVLQSANSQKIIVPSVAPKFADFVRRRRRIFREIRNMRKINNHVNVIRLENVLELVQESKCTIFLVMELANGGELFDRIKIDCGTREETARLFFHQLLLGVKHCHDQGVCHRDLKPENLLLQDTADQTTILKIADFGFSARFALGNGSVGGTNNGGKNELSATSDESASYDWKVVGTPRPRPVATDDKPLRILKSVVGSPFYVAPEVMQAKGYDGPRADIWSLGIILYAMLAGNLPFEQELSSCKRYRQFCKWAHDRQPRKAGDSADCPSWLFPAKFSAPAKDLIVAMLHPDPMQRISVPQAMVHPLLLPSPPPQADQVVEEQISKLSLTQQSSLPSSAVYDQPVSYSTIPDNVVKNLEAAWQIDEERMSASAKDQFLMDEEPPTLPTTDPSPDLTPALQPALATDSSCRPPLLTLPLASRRQTPWLPPLSLPHQSPSIADLLHPEDDEDCPLSPSSRHKPGLADPAVPPSFSDLVRRSTRFLTAADPNDVLDKLEVALEDCRRQNIPTPVGLVGRVELYWDTYRLEVWGSTDAEGPPLCALQLYQMAPSQYPVLPLSLSPASLRRPLSDHTGIHENSYSQPQLFVAEFIRGQLDIFAFKRFYQWVRQRLSQLVKRDFNCKLLDPAVTASSPTIQTSVLQLRLAHQYC